MLKVSWVGTKSPTSNCVQMTVEKYGLSFVLTQTFYPYTEENFWLTVEELRGYIRETAERLEYITIGEVLELQRNTRYEKTTP